jgi:diguanylate cyclase (GGDEF)-like protein
MERRGTGSTTGEVAAAPAAVRVAPRDERGQKIWTAVAMWSGGACALAVAAALPGAAGQRDGVLWLLLAGCVAVTLTLLVLFPRLSDRGLYLWSNVYSTLGSVTAGLACMASGGAASGLTEVYFFPVLYNAYFFKGRDVAWQLVVVSALAIAPLLYSAASTNTQYPAHATVLVVAFWVLSAIIRAYRRRMLSAEAESRRLSLSDPLTGLHNVRSLRDEADDLSRGCSLLLIDLNDFKDVNSRHGHVGADRILQAVAVGLLEVTDDTDCVARVGGDEFAILSRRRSFHGIERLRGACAAAVRDAPARAGLGGPDLLASIGVATWPRDGRDLTALLETADRSMFAQKSAFKLHGAEGSGARLPRHLAPTDALAAPAPKTAVQAGTSVDLAARLALRARALHRRVRSSRLSGLVRWGESTPAQGIASAAAWVGGGFITAVVVLLPGADPGHRVALEIIAGAAVMMGAVVLFLSRWNEAACYAGSDTLAAVFLTAGVVLTGGTMSPLLPVVFLPVSLSAYFFTPQRASVTLVACVAICASPFVYAPLDSLGHYVVRFVALATTATVLAGIVAYNKRQLVSAQLASQELAELDALSGLPNRRAFFSGLRRRLQDADARGGSVAVAVIDLDNFKTVNDRHGHAAGDAVLTAIGSSLRHVVRGEDFVARIGGDEFALVAYGAGPDLSRTLGIRCVRAVQYAVARAGFGDCEVSATVGFAPYPEHAPDPDGLLAVADRALMQAKEDGKRRVAAPDWAAAVAAR